MIDSTSTKIVRLREVYYTLEDKLSILWIKNYTLNNRLKMEKLKRKIGLLRIVITPMEREEI